MGKAFYLIGPAQLIATTGMRLQALTRQTLPRDLRTHVTCSPDCYQSEVESRLVHCYPTLDHSGLEFSALLRSGGLVSPAEFASMIGGIFPIALCGRSSL